MSKLTLDVNSLSVESFAANGALAVAEEPTTGTMTYAFGCAQNAVTPMTLTNRVCCEAAGVKACTVREPCCDVTP